MSEWYGVRAAVVSEKPVRTRPGESTSPESEAEVPPGEEPTADE
jgi:hypothetical protein